MATKRSAKKSTTSAKTASKAPVKTTTKPATKTVAAKRTAPKKAPVKTEAVKSTTVTTVVPEKTESEKSVTKTVATSKTTTPETTTTQTVKIRKPYLILIIVIILLGAVLYYFRGLFVAAVVNGQPISRLSVVQQAEKQSGKQTLDTLVRDALIEQEAKKEGVTVSDKEVSDQINQLQSNLQKQGQSLNDVLASQSMTMDDLRNLIRLDQLVQKMVGKGITVSNKEIDAYISQNKSSLPSTSGTALRQQVKAQLLQQKTNAAVQTWLANIQKKANILYFVQY